MLPPGRAVEVLRLLGKELMHFVLPHFRDRRLLGSALEDHDRQRHPVRRPTRVVIAHGGPQSHRKAPSGGDHLRWRRRHHPADRLPAACWAYCSMCLTSSWWAASCCSGSASSWWATRKERRRTSRHTSSFGPAIWSIAFAQHGDEASTNAIAITAAANGDFFLMCMGLIISGADHHRRRRPSFPACSPASPGLALVGRRADRLDRGRKSISGEGRREELRPDGTLVEVVQPGSIAAWLGRSCPACRGWSSPSSVRCSSLGPRHDHRPPSGSADPNRPDRCES